MKGDGAASKGSATSKREATTRPTPRPDLRIKSTVSGAKLMLSDKILRDPDPQIADHFFENLIRFSASKALGTVAAPHGR